MRNTMKLVRTIESFYPKVTGPANQAFKISSKLEKRGISCPIFTTNFDVKHDVNETEKIENVSVRRFPVKTRILKYIYSPKMKKALGALAKEDFDLIHAHCYRSYQSDISFKIAKKRNKPFVISTHGTLLSYNYFVDMPWKLAYDIYDIITLKKTVKKADAIVVNSSQEYNEAIKFGITKDKIHLIPVGIDIDKFNFNRKFEDKNKKKINLLFVGGVTRNRPLLPVLKAIYNINNDYKKENNNYINKDKNKKVKLTIIGSEYRSSFSGKLGYIDELKSYVNANNLQNEVEFYSHKTQSELVEFYKKADIFVYLSEYESFGQPLLEAAAAGLPVICSDVGIARDIFESEWIIENNKCMSYKSEERADNVVDIIADKIIKLFDASLRQKVGERNKEIVKKKFNWKEIINKYVELYIKLIAHKNTINKNN